VCEDRSSIMHYEPQNVVFNESNQKHKTKKSDHISSILVFDQATCFANILDAEG